MADTPQNSDVSTQIRLLTTQMGQLIAAIQSAFLSGPVGGTGRLTPTTFASLPAASAANRGTLACLTDSSTPVWGAVIAGGGANVVLAFSDGSNWTVAGK